MVSHSDSWKEDRLRPALGLLQPYVAGKGFGEISRRYGLRPEDIVKLGSNENPYGPSPGAKEALATVAMERYPEPEELLAGLSAYTGFPEDMILIGAGMDGVMDTLSRIFLDPGDSTFIPTPTFSYYEILTIMAAARPVFSARGPKHELAEAVPARTKMAFLCSPNNPTGNVMGEEQLRAILESTDAIVFLDEAYVEFAEESLIHLVKEYDNLIVGRTLSKAFGLAGMRLGYALAPHWIVRSIPPGCSALLWHQLCLRRCRGRCSIRSAFHAPLGGEDSHPKGRGWKRRSDAPHPRPTSSTSGPKCPRISL